MQPQPPVIEIDKVVSQIGKDLISWIKVRTLAENILGHGVLDLGKLAHLFYRDGMHFILAWFDLLGWIEFYFGGLPRCEMCADGKRRSCSNW